MIVTQLGATQPNQAPQLTLTSPADGTSVQQGDSVTLQANDAEDGYLGSGASLAISTLSEGVHTLTASVQDSLSASATDSVGLTFKLLIQVPECSLLPWR